MDKTSLGDRMKEYENVTRNKLIRRTPVIIRLDGKAFSTLTSKMDKPYDNDFKDIMMKVSEYLVENIMGCKLAYVQSDEISLLLIDYNTLETEAWFDNNIQKIASVSASMATAKFNEIYRNISEIKKVVDFGLFDSRVFNLPKEEVCNYFIWRQNDATRNSIQGLGQKEFGHKEMHGKNTSQVQDKLMLEKNINWNDVDTYFKRGGCVYRGVNYQRIVRSEPVYDDPNSFVPSKTIQVSGIGYRREIIVDNDIPVFTQDREYIDMHIYEIVQTSILDKYMTRGNSILTPKVLVDAASALLEEPTYDVFKDPCMNIISTAESKELINVASTILEEPENE